MLVFMAIVFQSTDFSEIKIHREIETSNSGPNKNGFTEKGTTGNKPKKKKQTKYALLK